MVDLRIAGIACYQRASGIGELAVLYSVNDSHLCQTVFDPLEITPDNMHTPQAPMLVFKTLDYFQEGFEKNCLQRVLDHKDIMPLSVLVHEEHDPAIT